MVRFSVGEEVVIRYGKEQGQKAKVLKVQREDGYKVRVEDGRILFCSSKGLEKKK
jgi:ribosomal protein L24